MGKIKKKKNAQVTFESTEMLIANKHISKSDNVIQLTSFSSTIQEEQLDTDEFLDLDHDTKILHVDTHPRNFLLDQKSSPTNTINMEENARDSILIKVTCRQRIKLSRSRVYNFLERPKSGFESMYHIFIFTVIIGCLVISILSTIEQYEPIFSTPLYYIELSMLTFFILEFALRLWSAGCKFRYKGVRGKLRFLRNPLILIDIIVILSTLLMSVIKVGNEYFPTSSLRALRILQVIRIIRFDRKGSTWKLLAQVTWNHRQELFTSAYIGFLLMFVLSFAVFLCERNVNKTKFPNFSSALWWGIITMSTVGYGDAIPVTIPGKIIAGTAAIIGISFFALPAGIMGSGFALQVRAQQRVKHITRRRIPAAVVIQCAWRVFCCSTKYNSASTWNLLSVNLLKHKTRVLTVKAKQRKTFKCIRTMTSRHLINNSDMMNNHLTQKMSSGQLEVESNSTDTPNISLKAHHGIMNNRYRNCVRFIRYLKFYVAMKYFKESVRPCDVKDVLDQYNVGNSELIQKVKGLNNKVTELQLTNDLISQSLLKIINDNKTISNHFKQLKLNMAEMNRNSALQNTGDVKQTVKVARTKSCDFDNIIK